MLGERLPTRDTIRATAIFIGSTYHSGAGRDGCRVTWEGALCPDGTVPPIRDMMGRRRDRQRAAYGLALKCRTWKTDRLVLTCCNPRCLDARHMRLIPAPKALHATTTTADAA